MLKRTKSTPDHLYAKKLGRLGEKIALKYLENLGYTLLHRNFSMRGGELDLIMSHNSRIIFFEIKTRRAAMQAASGAPKFGFADEQIGWRQRLTLVHSARAFLHLKSLAHCSWQFDLISINLKLQREGVPEARITHLQDIFSA